MSLYLLYSIVAHSNTACNSGVIEKSYVLNRPFYAREVKENTKGQLPESFSLVDCKTAGVMLETVKRAEDGDSVIVRMYEAYKERKTVQLSIPNAKEVFLCDLNEKEIETLNVNGNVVTFTIKPFEIVTIKIKGLFYGENTINEGNGNHR